LKPPMLSVQTPIGWVTLSARGGALVEVRLPPPGRAALGRARSEDPLLLRARRELLEYFAGDRSAFEVPLALGGTDFERAVYAAVLAIPIGDTRSYGEVARAIGRPRAARAVGAANGKNPLPIFVPCHRLLGADGSLVGYGGGEPMKRWLLEHETRVAGRRRSGRGSPRRGA